MDSVMRSDYYSSSLYVGDLHPEVTEKMLLDKFSEIAPVSSIRLCCDPCKRKSNCYAYVTFEKQEDDKNDTTAVERAIDWLNCTRINGMPMRIMKLQPDTSLRKSGVGNIFLKNLDKKLDVQALHDTFSQLGPILSCKIPMGSDGKSKGFGFIHYENQADATIAVEKVNGKLLNNRKLFAEKFIPKSDRAQLCQEKATTNLFIKNIPLTFGHEKLLQLFEKFGSVSSYCIQLDTEESPKGTGFVAFNEPQAAIEAIRQMNGKLIEGNILHVALAHEHLVTKARARFGKNCDILNQKSFSRCMSANLYVKNLAKSIDEIILKNLFQCFGTVVSIRIMTHQEGKNFGFVCMSTSEEASKALSGMHGKLILGKPLYVALTQGKEDRQKYLDFRRVKPMANDFVLPRMLYNNPSSSSTAQTKYSQISVGGQFQKRELPPVQSQLTFSLTQPQSSAEIQQKNI